MNNAPILITGCARSGTSMTAGAIHLCGAFGGDVRSTKGKRAAYENNFVRQYVEKPYLRSIGCDPMGQNPLPSVSQVLGVTPEQALRLRQMVVEGLTAQGLPPGRVWYYKGAKMCLVWYRWTLAFPEARWVIVRRRDEDIVNSCLKTGFMRAFGSSEGWQGWVDTHKKRFREMEAAGLDVREVWPEKMIRGDFSEMRGVVEELGLQWNDEAVRRHIQPALWSGQKEEG